QLWAGWRAWATTPAEPPPKSMFPPPVWLLRAARKPTDEYSPGPGFVSLVMQSQVGELGGRKWLYEAQRISPLAHMKPRRFDRFQLVAVEQLVGVSVVPKAT